MATLDQIYTAVQSVETTLASNLSTPTSTLATASNLSTVQTSLNTVSTNVSSLQTSLNTAVISLRGANSSATTTAVLSAVNTMAASTTLAAVTTAITSAESTLMGTSSVPASIAGIAADLSALSLGSAPELNSQILTLLGGAEGTALPDLISAATTTMEDAFAATAPPLQLQVFPQAFLAGVSRPTFKIATFFTSATSGNVTATLDWGDGSSPQALTIDGDASPYYMATGSHIYTLPGVYVITIAVSITIDATTTIYYASSTSTVQDSPLSASGSSSITSTGSVTHTVVGGFTSTNPMSSTSHFQALIDWGDGTALSAGTLTQPGGIGTAFLVSGSHTYTESGTYSLQVFVTGIQSRVIITNTATATVDVVPSSPPVSAASSTGILWLVFIVEILIICMTVLWLAWTLVPSRLSSLSIVGK